ncbi:hypothetical protein GCM10010371_57260 [Streptomyces subrutilus]|uniref:Uncharacterized protein n=1 Tax=Streptomyces subrutilus TaxID=36818 RepID=A0A918RAA2_9ACTN|nr:hypothetical protein [Streptomyces subrutilus]GGZ89917.1 hypothetical protein GCM10010371_57260 [Streptomyces subrutilus]
MDRNQHDSARDNERAIPTVPGQRKAPEPTTGKSFPKQRDRRAQ